MKTYTEISNLLLKHLRQELTPVESAQLTAWVEMSEKNRQFFADINNTPALIADVQAHREGQQIDLDAAWERIKAYGWETETVTQPNKILKMKWWHYMAAAVLLIALFIPIYLYLYPNKPGAVPQIVHTPKNDVRPNSSHAYLTLDNGETISLDSANGLLAWQGSMRVEKKSGALSYSADGHVVKDKPLYNKITVPKGSDVVYLQLSDQTKVWLNAESSIKYPVVFTEYERKVEVTGEVYFEVTSLSPTADGINNKTGKAESGKGKRPFIVSTGNMSVVVLGTKFNMNAYDDEDNIKVTLLDGRVRVQSNANGNQVEKVITPGQQAVLYHANINVLSDIDLEQVTAWKQGKFVFNDTNLDVIMRQIQRWYDVEVTYEGDIKSQGITFTGRISRYNNASKVLDLMHATGLFDFVINGRKVTVKPVIYPFRN